MTAESPRRDLDGLLRTAERLDQLADMAELMGDANGAARYRQFAVEQQMLAMRLLDDQQ